MYEQAIGIGAVTRSTAAPAEASATLAASAPSALAAAPVAAFATHVASAASYLDGSGSAGTFDAQVQRVLTASADGLVVTAPAANGSEFDYWLEDLML